MDGSIGIERCSMCTGEIREACDALRGTVRDMVAEFVLDIEGDETIQGMGVAQIERTQQFEGEMAGVGPQFMEIGCVLTPAELALGLVVEIESGSFLAETELNDREEAAREARIAEIEVEIEETSRRIEASKAQTDELDAIIASNDQRIEDIIAAARAVVEAPEPNWSKLESEGRSARDSAIKAYCAQNGLDGSDLDSIPYIEKLGLKVRI